MCGRSRISAVNGILIVPIFLFLTFFSVEGTLLCFGPDGHIAIEFVDSCNGSDSGSQVAGVEEDACGPCKDIQFLSSPAHTGNSFNYSQTLPMLSSVWVHLSLAAKEYLYNLADLPETPHQKSLASIQSVVILI